MPNRLDIDAVVLVAEPIAKASNIVPGLAGTKRGTLLAEANCSFADEGQFSLNGGYRTWILPEGLQIHAICELDDHRNTVDDVPESEPRFLKRQEPPRASHAPEPAP